MIKIERLRVEIQTTAGLYGFDEHFNKDMNIICSEQNTSGKSSIISSIYYGLGLEEIIGGKGYNVLSSAFKTYILSNDKELKVLESKVYLEISNGMNNITIFRSAKMKNRDCNLMTIYYSKMKDIHNVNTKVEDMYVHSPNSATSNKGYFTFLESFIGFHLPKVPGTDDKEKKLYLQLIFSSMLIEQKRGWADLFSGMPHFGIKESKKRVIEFLLNMDTLKNEKLKNKLKITENRITNEWKDLYKEYTKDLEKLNLYLKGITENVEILKTPDKSINIVFKDEDRVLTLKEYIHIKKTEYEELITYKIKDKENVQELQEELLKIEEEISSVEHKISDLKSHLNNENISLSRSNKSLEIIKNDILNNQDARKLRKLGSIEGFNTFKDKCPTCNQSISDTLLVSQNNSDVMTIEDNIKHLKSQEKVFVHAINQKSRNIERYNHEITKLKKVLLDLHKLAKVTRNDIYAIDGTLSERKVYKKIELSNLIEKLERININHMIEAFKALSKEWEQYHRDLSQLPKQKFTDLDEKKIKFLRNSFVSNLKSFGYRSTSDIDKVMISRDSYMPIIENFDLKFDSSASDHIRRIWAFTIALVQTSNALNGNHPGILIFDEPGQHSIVVEDMEEFLNCLIDLSNKSQVIIGITIKETDTKKLVNKKVEEGSNGIYILDRAFNRIN